MWQLWHPRTREHTTCPNLVWIPFSMNGTSWVNGWFQRGQGKYKSRLKYLDGLKHKKGLKEWWRWVRKTQKPLMLQETEFILPAQETIQKTVDMYEISGFQNTRPQATKDPERWEMKSPMTSPVYSLREFPDPDPGGEARQSPGTPWVQEKEQRVCRKLEARVQLTK